MNDRGIYVSTLYVERICALQRRVDQGDPDSDQLKREIEAFKGLDPHERLALGLAYGNPPATAQPIDMQLWCEQAEQKMERSEQEAREALLRELETEIVHLERELEHWRLMREQRDLEKEKIQLREKLIQEKRDQVKMLKNLDERLKNPGKMGAGEKA